MKVKTLSDISLTDYFRRLIKETRKIRGWSQADLAQRANIPFGTYSHFERGKISLDVDRFFRILELLDLKNCIMSAIHEQEMNNEVAREVARRNNTKSL